MTRDITIGVLALQGAFYEHIKLLGDAVIELESDPDIKWEFIEVRTPSELAKCDALIIPGGESTTVSLVAERSNLLEPLRNFVKYVCVRVRRRGMHAYSIYWWEPANNLFFHIFRVARKPVWGTCAGLILLAESANRTKKGGQQLIGGLDVRVHRNYFGRQIESFEAALHLPFLREYGGLNADKPFRGIFIRAPVVETLLVPMEKEQVQKEVDDEVVMAPSRKESGPNNQHKQVEIMATLPGRSKALKEMPEAADLDEETGNIVAVLQGNVFGTSFHPELTKDTRIHRWWLNRVIDMGRDG